MPGMKEIRGQDNKRQRDNEDHKRNVPYFLLTFEKSQAKS